MDGDLSGRQSRSLVVIPAGTTILVEGAFDNSPTNPANPDPNASVSWGDQSWEEMFIANMQMKYVDSGAP